MKRSVVLGILLAAGTAAMAAQTPAAPKVIDVQKLRDNLYVLTSSTPGNAATFSGGNVGLQSSHIRLRRLLTRFRIVKQLTRSYAFISQLGGALIIQLRVARVCLCPLQFRVRLSQLLNAIASRA